ncbi:cation efflux protein, CzcI family [uncultured Xylophilus sp.]|uniref:cation efflux protein, CzcI family n=1 Tax=uncultured Xylophilus sp. TaxID=296832 RepID=UPI0025FCE0C0|nr:cation efflux protein, CzcI family [uncultured Xylophilus sp.]
MRRWLAILLLALLPFQFAWSAAAQYCAHGSEAPARVHFGHHAHEHGAGSHASGADKGDDGGAAKLMLHADCGQCHMACGLAPVGVPALAHPVPAAFAAPHQGDAARPAGWPDRPERPQWQRLA